MNLQNVTNHTVYTLFNDGGQIVLVCGIKVVVNVTTPAAVQQRALDLFRVSIKLPKV